MCRRCCCRDVYLWNGDSISNQFRTRVFSQEPVVRHQLLPATGGYGRFAIDYRSQRTFLTHSSSAGAHLYTTDDLQWERPRFLGLLVSSTDHNLRAMACDAARQKLYYISSENTTPIWQLRSINYDGTGDVQIIDEPVLAGTGGGMDVGNALNYDPGGDRLYYWRDYTIVDTSGFPVSPTLYTRKYEIRSVKPDGTDSQTHGAFVVYGPSSTSPFNTWTFGYGHIALPRFIVGLIFINGAGDNTQHNALTIFDVASGARTDVLTSTNNLDGQTPFRRFISPSYCYADGKLYFGSQWFNNPAGQPAYNFVTYNRCNLDGSGEEVVFSFRDNQPPNDNPFNWDPVPADAQTGVLFRLGCGFENVGDKYGGAG